MVTVVFLPTMLGCNWATSGYDWNDPTTWPELNRQLEEAISTSADVTCTGLAHSKAYRELKQASSPQQLRHMIANAEQVTVRFAAFCAATYGNVGTDRNPENDVHCALSFLLHSMRLESAFAEPAWELLSSHANNDPAAVLQEMQGFAKCANFTQLSTLSVILGRVVPASECYRWLHDQVEAIPHPFLAVVLGYLLDETSPSSQMRANLEACGEVSGYPLFVYLVHATPDSSEYTDRFFQLLHDEEIDDLHLSRLLLRRKRWLAQHWPEHDDVTKVPAARRQMVDRFLAQRPEER